jgi:hypothetical protein
MEMLLLFVHNKTKWFNRNPVNLGLTIKVILTKKLRKAFKTIICLQMSSNTKTRVHNRTVRVIIKQMALGVTKPAE